MLPKEEILNKYNLGNSVKKLSIEYCVSEETIRKLLIKVGYNSRVRKKIFFSDEQEDLIIKKYLEKESIKKISKHFNVSSCTIRKVLENKNISIRDVSLCQRKYHVDETTFNKIDSAEKAYWIGFLATDGNIYDNIVSIALQARDKNHIEKFKKLLKSNHPIYDIDSKLNNKIFKSVKFQIRSDKLCDDLISLGITKNKSLTLKPQKIKDEFVPDYIRGLIDGDGCIHIRKDNQMSISFIGTFEVCSFISQNITMLCNIKPSKIKRRKNVYHIRWNGNKISKKITDAIYYNGCIALDRKFEKINSH